MIQPNAERAERTIIPLPPSLYRTLLAVILVLMIGVFSGLAIRLHAIAQKRTFLGTRDLVLQSSPITCGPAALAYVLRASGLDVAEAELQSLTNPGPNGTSMLSLALAAEHFGFRAYGLKLSYDDLSQITLPAIAYFQQHFVVITRVLPTGVEIGDPLSGFHFYPTKAFLRVWQGQILIVEG